MIRLNNITKSFGQFNLGPISLSIDDGDYWVILGPSGSGKSMLLHLIAGIFKPEAGEFFIAGKNMKNVAAEKRNIGLVFQQAALFPHLSIIENIVYGLKVRRINKATKQQRIQELVDCLDLLPILNHPVSTLSGGEIQKVAIARALAIQPRLLLLDEPLSSVDYHARTPLQNEILRVHKQYRLTTIHVTHDREEAYRIASHIAIIANGLVQQADTITQVREQPTNDFVKAFLR